MKLISKVIIILEITILIFVYFSRFSFFKKKRILDFSGEKVISINDDGLEYLIKTHSMDVGGLLAENKINLGDQDELIPAKSSQIFPGMGVLINRPAKVKISVDGKNIEKTSFAKTVLDLLNENNITISHLDKIEPSSQTRLSDGMEIEITRINYEEVTEDESIDFTEIKQKDSTVNWGEKVVTQDGEEGVREVTYKITYKNGEEVSRQKLDTKITKTPVTQITKIGTKIQTGKNESGIASWYATGDLACSSRTFSPGSWLRVTNRTNGKQIYVRVEGYGPQEGTGKVIDINKKSFSQIAPIAGGVAKVKVEEILNKGFNPNALNDK